MSENSKYPGAKETTERELLRDIRELLRERVPVPSCKSWIRKRKGTIVCCILFLSLFIIDFSFGQRSNCDVVVTEGTEITVIERSEPNWAEIGIPEMNPDYWKIPQPDGKLVTVFSVSFVRVGLKYEHSGIRVMRGEESSKVDLIGSPVTVKAPTTVIIEPIDSSGNSAIINQRIIRICAFKF